MPRFHFEALDSGGAVATGSLDAASANEAVREITRRGLKLRSLRPDPTAPVPQPTPVAPAPQPLSPQPQAQPRPKAVPQPIASPAPRAAVRTRQASYNDRFFLFTQLSSMFHAGIAPHEALRQLAPRSRPSAMQAALTDIANDCAGGASLADGMARYPDLFPPGVVGAVRAGETGGYLPQACADIAAQQRTSRTFSLGFWWARAVVISSALAVPPILALAQGFDRMIASINDPEAANRSSGENVAYLFQGMGQALVGPIGIGMLLFIGGYVAFQWWFRGRDRLPLRHRLSAQLPLVKKRTKAENVLEFSRHYGRLSAAGLAPQTAFRLAAEAVPNLHISESLVGSAGAMRDQSRTSEAIAASRLFPEEYGHLVATGEFTGTVPQAMEQLTYLSEADKKRADQAMGIKIGCWTLIFMVGSAALAYVIFFSFYVNSMMRHVLGE